VARPSKRQRQSATEVEPIAELFAEIYAVARRIPHGRVATYGQVAELAGLPGGAPTVGREICAGGQVCQERMIRVGGRSLQAGSE